jgi:hypothetical protein
MHCCLFLFTHSSKQHENVQTKLQGVSLYGTPMLAEAATGKSPNQAPKGYKKVHE